MHCALQRVQNKNEELRNSLRRQRHEMHQACKKIHARYQKERLMMAKKLSSAEEVAAYQERVRLPTEELLQLGKRPPEGEQKRGGKCVQRARRAAERRCGVGAESEQKGHNRVKVKLKEE